MIKYGQVILSRRFVVLVPHLRFGFLLRTSTREDSNDRSTNEKGVDPCELPLQANRRINRFLAHFELCIAHVCHSSCIFFCTMIAIPNTIPFPFAGLLYKHLLFA